MEPRLLLFSLLFLLFSTLFAFQVIWLLRQLKQYLNGGSAKNVYVINYDNNTFQNRENVSPEIESGKEMDRALKNETSTHQSEKELFNFTRVLNEKRKYPRINFEGYVDFVKEGELLKGKSKDISYSGIFIKSQTPYKHKENDRILITFLTPEGYPQKRNGTVVRKNENGIGIQFVC